MKIREKRTISKNEKNEVDLNLSTLHFNLRSPKSLIPTQLYAILYIRYKGGGSKQFKLPLNCKILPSNWNQKRETVIYNGTENENTLKSLNRVLTIINILRLFFLNIICTFAMSSIDDNVIKNKLELRIKDYNMNKENLSINRGITASTVVNKAFQEMYGNNTKKPSTVKMQKGKLDNYVRYLKSGNVTDSAKHRLTVKGMNEYRKYLHDINPKLSMKQSYKHIEFIISLINHAVANGIKDIGITQIQTDGFTKTDVIRDTKRDNKHIEIEKDELELLKSTPLDNKKERDIRDLFLFGCTIGCRYSDLYRITRKAFEIKDTSEGKMLVYETQKGQSKHITAFVPFSISPIISSTLDRINNYKFNIPSSSSYFSKVLKNIFKKANLRRPITFKDANGAEHTKELCDVISSHDMRVTGTTQLLRKYENTQFVVRACGWTDDKMIREVYGRLTVDDEARLQSERILKATREKNTVQSYDELKDLRNALVYLGAKYEDVCDITSISDLYTMVKEFEDVLLKKGVSIKVVKEIYNEQITMKERMGRLKIACDVAMKNAM